MAIVSLDLLAKNGANSQCCPEFMRGTSSLGLLNQLAMLLLCCNNLFIFTKDAHRGPMVRSSEMMSRTTTAISLSGEPYYNGVAPTVLMP